MIGPTRAIDLGPRPPRRRWVSLTPLIDVIFLLLVFFMLASRFAVENEIPIAADAGASGASGPPRIVDVAPEALRLNGRLIALEALGPAVRRLAPTGDALVAVRLGSDVDVQRMVDVMDALAAARLSNVVFVER